MEHISFGNVRVEQAEFSDNGATVIGQHWINYVVGVSEAFERRLGIITYSGSDAISTSVILDSSSISTSVSPHTRRLQRLIYL